MVDGSVMGTPTGLTTLVCGSLAYMNPGTGSFLLQVLMVGLAGAVVTIKSTWTSLKHFLSRKK